MRGRLGRSAIVAVLWAGACATSTTDRIEADETVDTGRSYLYGRFFMNAPPHQENFGGKQSMGFRIQCEHGSSYTFGSTDKRNVQVMEVKPGRCWLMSVIVADDFGMPQKTLPVDRKDQRPLDFVAGRAYYIGDYFAKADYWIRSRGLTNIEHLEWVVSPGVGDHYAQTTAEMQRGFPHLAALPTVALPLLPPTERKRDNGIGPAPGEPPMSPARAAVLAPFIKRTYATPAQCEAACPAGQCFPYRGASGAAMVCVIRCNKDADCPRGSGCNCPDSEKSAADCVPIAVTPTDSMARICLAAPTAEPAPEQAALKP